MCVGGHIYEARKYKGERPSSKASLNQSHRARGKVRVEFGRCLGIPSGAVGVEAPRAQREAKLDESCIQRDDHVSPDADAGQVQ